MATGIGGFSGLFALGDGRYLSAATDGVGTKLEVARLAGRFDTVGIDLVAMSANDVVCTGAEPLFFLDYLAVERLVPEQAAADRVRRRARGAAGPGARCWAVRPPSTPARCRPARSTSRGSASASLPEEQLLSPERVRPGDALVGFRSSGLHSNGYSLVRRRAADARTAIRTRVRRPSWAGRSATSCSSRPRSTCRPLLALRDAGLAEDAPPTSPAGGFHENVPRALPAGLGADIDPPSWEPQPIFGVVADAAGVATRGAVLGASTWAWAWWSRWRPEDAARAVEIATQHGADAVVAGTVTGRARGPLPGERLTGRLGRCPPFASWPGTRTGPSSASCRRCWR